MAIILEMKNIKVVRGKAMVLDLPYLDIREGEILSVIGQNGAGKSTLLLSLGCLLTLSKGEIFFKGKLLSSRQEQFQYRRSMAMVFQEPLLFDTTVFKNVASGLKIRGLSRKIIQDRAPYYLNQFGIEHLANRLARKLSGGEAKRTSLARAFALQPEIIFLDEPFAALDPPTHNALIQDIKRILSKTKTTAVMATHNLIEAASVSNRIAFMNQGKIIQIGSPENILHHPQSEVVSNFIRSFSQYQDMNLPLFPSFLDQLRHS